LDPNRTSPYKFYQYWLNTSDEDAEKYIKIFTFLDQKTIEELITEHGKEPHLRLLQKRLAEEVTITVHGKEDFENAVKASSVLFGKSTASDFRSLNEATFLDIFEGVPQAEIERADIDTGLDMIAALAAKTDFLKSNGEARRALKENAISVNKEKVKEDFIITADDLIANKYVLLQRGKKTNYLLIVE
jgi:tyrosyl-tRNA synthetase